ncbi:MAG TPA: hypothetical protein VGL46_03265 [Pseudonocardiaceae bacterium]
MECARCGMNSAVTLVNRGQRPAYFDQLAATVEEIGRLQWLLRQVITLADDAPGLTDEQLRDRLAALGAVQVCHPGTTPPRSPSWCGRCE